MIEAVKPKPSTSLAQIPRGVWALGFVSLLMDISVGDDPCAAAGLSGDRARHLDGDGRRHRGHRRGHRLDHQDISPARFRDWLGKRKLLAALGYGLAAFTKPVFPLAPIGDWLVAARFIDRVGKGIRGAPRDALIADIAPADLRGASFGLRQSLDTVGAFIGPLLAIGLMWLTADNFRPCSGSRSSRHFCRWR